MKARSAYYTGTPLASRSIITGTWILQIERRTFRETTDAIEAILTTPKGTTTLNLGSPRQLGENLAKRAFEIFRHLHGYAPTCGDRAEIEHALEPFTA